MAKKFKSPLRTCFVDFLTHSNVRKKSTEHRPEEFPISNQFGCRFMNAFENSYGLECNKFVM